MKNVFSFLTSAPLMGALLILLAIAMGTATFIENSFGTNAARSLVYNAWWFEGLFALLGCNLIGNLLKFNMYRWKKLPLAMFHLSFLLIIVGAAATRYMGFEGTMHIREASSSDQILSTQTYVTIKTTDPNFNQITEKAVDFSTISPFEVNLTTKNGIDIKSIVFIPSASLQPIDDKDGVPHLSLMITTAEKSGEILLKHRDKYLHNNFTIGFEAIDTAGLQMSLSIKGDSLYFESKVTVIKQSRKNRTVDTLVAGKKHPFEIGAFYTVGLVQLVPKQFWAKAVTTPIYQPNVQGLPEAVVFSVKKGGQIREVIVTGRPSEPGQPTSTTIGNTTIEVSYGAKSTRLPFSLHLNKFEIERYPGSHSPSSFASNVVLEDTELNLQEERRIFMNNILDYRGYRFFQSSYDSDEKGTILSVNRDPIGTPLTYAGYLIMALGMVLALVVPGTRFRSLYARFPANQRKPALTIVLLTFASLGFAQTSITRQQADKFGSLWVQDNQGRTKPLNSLNSEISRKLVKHNSFKDMSADQLVLGIMADPAKWKKEPLITIAHPALRQLLKPIGKKAAFGQFFRSDGSYIIANEVEAAYRKKPSDRNKFDQEVIKVDEQVNVFYMVQAQRLFKLFPNPSNPQAPWLTPNDMPGSGFNVADSLFATSTLQTYLRAIAKNNPAEADSLVNNILEYQTRHAKGILPSEQHKKLEIFYNDSNIFMLMMPFLMALGTIMLIFQFLGLMVPRLSFKVVDKIGFGMMVLTIVTYALGLALRWYIAGHAPLSNGYESMLYIGFSTLLAGLIFGPKNSISLSVAALFASVILMVAHLSWMNPEITNLVPVLKSHWLTIHVAVITASYGFLGLGAFMSFMALTITAIKTGKNAVRFSTMVHELSTITEMSLTVGLYLLTIGSFLGGIWANESWGRYWGWDPKETWSAVTILVYAFVLHMRLIPGLKSKYAFNLAAIIAFSSVVMTYLGVNYYLAGMHSYGKGHTLPLPAFVYYATIAITVVSVAAWYNESKCEKRPNELKQ